MKYHVSPDGTPRRCNPVKTGVCRFGEDVVHFDDKTSALAYAEEKLSSEFSTLEKNTASRKHAFKDIKELRAIDSSYPQDLEAHIEQSKRELSKLPKEQQIVINSYTGFGAGIVNQLMLGEQYIYNENSPPWREGDGATDFNSREELKDYIEVLDKTLSKRSDQERILFRGIPVYESIHADLEQTLGRKIALEDTNSLVEAIEKHYPTGKIIQNDTYISSTVDPDIAVEFAKNQALSVHDPYDRAEKAGIIFEMKTNAGVDVLGGANRSYQIEREVVLPRETYFKISKVYTAPEQYLTPRNEDAVTNENDYKRLAVVIQMEEVDKEGNPIEEQTHTPKRSADEALNSAV